MSGDNNSRGAFEDVDLWIFDLDNTLYPRPEGLWTQIDTRMRKFIGDELGLEPEAAGALQKDYFRRYGLTMRGLMLNHGIDPDVFNIFVHDVDLSDISPNPVLGAAIDALPGRRIVHSNANAGHIERVLDRLGISEVFDAAYDIASVGYLPKPAQDSYRRVLNVEGTSPRNTVMFEDMAHNLVEPHALGMRTVWTPTQCDWACTGSDGEHIHHVADDLTAFVQDLAPETAAA